MEEAVCSVHKSKVQRLPTSRSFLSCLHWYDSQFWHCWKIMCIPGRKHLHSDYFLKWKLQWFRWWLDSNLGTSHYVSVTSQITNNFQFVQQIVQVNSKANRKDLHYWFFVREPSGHLWIPITNRRACGKCFDVNIIMLMHHTDKDKMSFS